MPLQSNSIVLRDAPPCESLRTRLDDVLLEVKPQIGLFFFYKGRIDRAPGVVVHQFFDPARTEVDVRLVCDDVLGARYVNVTGPDPVVRSAILDALAQHFDTVPVEELREAAQRAGDERSWLLLALGIRTPFDEPTSRLISEAMVSPDVERRRSAAEAAAMLVWPELDGMLSQALARETDADVRQLLRLALQGEPAAGT
jgi:hypothetical protein